MTITVNPPSQIKVTAVSPNVFSVTSVTPTPISVIASTTGATGLSAYEIWIGQGHTGTEADYLASLIGPQGIQGIQGVKGDKGDKGDPGTGGGGVSSVNTRTGDIVLTSSDVGLSNVDNTSDLGKPISTATQSALDLKVDKVSGKGLSTNDYTTLEQTKLAGIAAGAEVNVNADWNASSGDAQILNKPTIPDANALKAFAISMSIALG
jgi:hypothetical protein